MRILLVNPYASSRRTAGRYRRFLTAMPPISLAYVAAALEEAGHEVVVYDDYTADGDRKGLFDFIETRAPRAVGFTCVTPTANRTSELCAELKRRFPKITRILGNIHPTVFYKAMLENDVADVVVLGEAEESVVNLLDALESGASIARVRGIAYRRDSGIAVTEPQPFIRDLDGVPFPAWRLFPRERYRIFNFASVHSPGTLVLGSRGCPYNCTFCSLKIMGRRRRRRSAANIADEIERNLEEYGYRQASFIDPIFPFSREEALDFSAEMVRRGLHAKVVWVTETRVDHVDEEMLAAMREAGLRRIMYGFEAGSDRAMEHMRKNTTVAQARSAVLMSRRAGLQITGFFMLGVPGDTVKSIEQTIRFAASLNIDFAKFTVFSPFPGTQTYNELLKSGEITPTHDWERFTNYPTRAVPPVYLPRSLSTRDIIRFQKRALVKVYLRPLMIFRHLFVIRSLGVRDLVSALLTLFQPA
ncbi:MAG: radical SAM protein [bacterium]